MREGAVSFRMFFKQSFLGLLNRSMGEALLTEVTQNWQVSFFPQQASPLHNLGKRPCEPCKFQGLSDTCEWFILSES